MTGSIGRLVRLAGVLALAGFTVGCAGQQQGPGASAPAGFGKDPGSRAERLVSYCDRMAKKGEMVTALGLCARAHEIDPDDPETLMKIAALLTSMNRQQAAVQTYNALLERHPRHHEARYSLGKLYMESGEVALAAIEFEHAMASDPKDP
ncbi:MAG: tetratricopeptide repeat protein, partial [Kiloniellaceae bacterium]